MTPGVLGPTLSGFGPRVSPASTRHRAIRPNSYLGPAAVVLDHGAELLKATRVRHCDSPKASIMSFRRGSLISSARVSQESGDVTPRPGSTVKSCDITRCIRGHLLPNAVTVDVKGNKTFMRPPNSDLGHTLHVAPWYPLKQLRCPSLVKEALTTPFPYFCVLGLCFFTRGVSRDVMCRH